MFYRLLMKFGANVNQQTKSGDTPCHLAAYRGYSLIVQLLVEGGASLRVVNNKCRTPLEDAQSRGHTEIVRYISAVNKIRKYSRNLSKISPICMYFKKIIYYIFLEFFKLFDYLNHWFTHSYNYSAIYLILRKLIFLFLYSQALNLTGGQTGSPRSPHPCKKCTCSRVTTATVTTGQKIPTISQFNPKTIYRFCPTRNLHQKWPSGIFNRSWFDFYENIGADLCLAPVKSRAILGSVLDIVI